MVTQEFETTQLAAKIRPDGHIFGVVTRCQTDIFLSTSCFKALIPKQATAAGRISLQQEETEPGSSRESLLLMASRREEDGEGLAICILTSRCCLQQNLNQYRRTNTVAFPTLLCLLEGQLPLKGRRSRTADVSSALSPVAQAQGPRRLIQGRQSRSRYSLQIMLNPFLSPPPSILVSFTVRSLLSSLTYEGDSKG